MFDLKRPCKTCPFRVDRGDTFGFSAKKLAEIIAAPAFQCHSTVDYEHYGHPRKQQGDKPQQCAGLMSLLHRADKPNQIMQVAERLGHFDPNRLDHSEVYPSIRACAKAHSKYR